MSVVTENTVKMNKQIWHNWPFLFTTIAKAVRKCRLKYHTVTNKKERKKCTSQSNLNLFVFLEWGVVYKKNNV